MVEETDAVRDQATRPQRAVQKALIAAAVTREMKDAQHAVAFERYLRPAIEFCEARGFTSPLSLAAVYDSIVHGSFDRIASRVPRNANEKTWITDYIRKRHLWLSNIARLRSTTYRTKFFLDQIAIGNWDLKLPLNVHGVRLNSVARVAEPTVSAGGTTAAATSRERIVDNVGSADASAPPAYAGGSAFDASPTPNYFPTQPTAERSPTPPHVGSGTSIVETATGTFDQVDRTITGVATRTDRAKFLWTTVAGTTWQTAWAIFGWLAGIPREVWIVVAVIVASLLLLYLYRQVSLGKLREAAARQADG